LGRKRRRLAVPGHSPVDAENIGAFRLRRQRGRDDMDFTSLCGASEQTVAAG